MIDALIQTGTKAPMVQSIVMSGSIPTKIQNDRIQAHLDARIYDAYGSTELGFVAISKIINGIVEGLVISPEVKLEIVDSDNKVLPRGETGVVRYAKANMTKRYINSEEATNESFQNNFFYPGDLGFLDALGRLHIIGRTNDVINLGGVKIRPEIVEEIALRVPGVTDAAAFSLIDNKGVTRLALAYVVESGFDFKNLEDDCTRELRAISVAKFVEVKSIPRNENGKIPRTKLAELLFPPRADNA